MYQLIAIALGGSAGALARFWIASGIYAWLGRGFPHGTLWVNVTGCLLMGFLNEVALQRFALNSEFRAAVLIGFLGAYTTFSTFALETLALFDQGAFLKAALNVVASVLLCLCAVWIGALLGRRLLAVALWDSVYAGLSWPWVGLSVLLAFLVGLWLGRHL